MTLIALLATSLLFGGMTLYSFGFAPLVFSALPMDTAGKFLRQAFPYYYLFVIVTSVIAALALWPFDPLSAGLMATCAGAGLFARQFLMTMINFFRDRGESRNFNRAHFLSVAINMLQLLAVLTVLVRLAQ
jgi:Domain of unknown function (DUF4149)